MILARTMKGRGFSEIEDHEGWHGKPLPPELAERAIVELGGVRQLMRAGRFPRAATARRPPERGGDAADLRDWRASRHPPRRSGRRSTAIGARSNLVALDAEVGNSTYADASPRPIPERYFEMFIAEQQMVAAAVGLSVRGYVPFASTFAAFFTRAPTSSGWPRSRTSTSASRLPCRRRDR